MVLESLPIAPQQYQSVAVHLLHNSKLISGPQVSEEISLPPQTSGRKTCSFTVERPQELKAGKKSLDEAAEKDARCIVIMSTNTKNTIPFVLTDRCKCAVSIAGNNIGEDRLSSDATINCSSLGFHASFL